MTDDDLALAHMLADAAGDAIRPWFRTRLEIEDKADASPVTRADRAAEAAIREILRIKRPQDGVIGEEYGADRPDAERVWVIDPIDGTRSFIAGRPIFGTLVALLEAGRPVLGVIDQPIGQERWMGAQGHPTTFNGNAARVRPCAILSEALLATTGPSYFDKDGLAAFERVSTEARHTYFAGDCYNYGLLASGHLDLVVEAGLKLYDFAALVPVVEGAGGGMCDWSGAALTAESDGRVIALGDVRLLESVMERLDG